MSINHSFLYVDVPFLGFCPSGYTKKERDDFDKQYKNAKENILANPPVIEITNTSKEETQLELIPEEPFLKLDNKKIILKPDETVKIKVLINEFSENNMGEIKIICNNYETSVIIMTPNYIGGD